jgi:hypothetical protein
MSDWTEFSFSALFYRHEKTPGSVTVFPPQAFFTFNLLLTRFKNIIGSIKSQVCQVTVI